MHYRNVVCLLSYSLFLSSAWGCELASVDPNVYQQQGKGVVYLRPNQNTNLSLPDVNYKRLRRLANLLIDPATLEDWEEIPPLTDLSTDYYTRGAHAWYPDYSWHSDGRYIIYAGKIVQNPAGTPPVDVMSFKAWGDFAADTNSLYFRGERTDDNGGDKPLDSKTLHQMNLPPPWESDVLGLILRDANFLYINGHRIAETNSFRVLAQKSWDKRGKFSMMFNTCIRKPFGPWDTLARTQAKIMLNGEQLDADPDTFTVVRWIPESLISWRDKNGFHRKVLDQAILDSDEENSCGSFNAKEHYVTWRSAALRKGSECQQEVIPGLDPEQFHPISDAVAQYQDKLYVIETTPFGERNLNIVTLDDPKLIINKRFNAGKRHGYLLTRKGDEVGDSGLQVFESAGPLILFDNHIPSEREAHQGSSNPYSQKWLARDDKYVYHFDGMQLWRYHTADPRAVRVVNDQLDGKINGDGEFIPTPRDEAKK